MAFGENVRFARLTRDLSQEDLARLTGHAQGHISEIEGGLVNVHLETASLFARALGVTLAELIARHPDVSLAERDRFGIEVQRARLHAGWSQDTLAAMCRTNRRMIDAVERGAVRLTAPLLQEIGRKLDLETEHLEERV